MIEFKRCLSLLGAEGSTSVKYTKFGHSTRASWQSNLNSSRRDIPLSCILAVFIFHFPPHFCLCDFFPYPPRQIVHSTITPSSMAIFQLLLCHWWGPSSPATRHQRLQYSLTAPSSTNSATLYYHSIWHAPNSRPKTGEFLGECEERRKWIGRTSV